ncbi:MAG TPA: hypothetical protein VFQ29_11515 [Methyloceanibacter sp.]|nr:hypothetical protein [Methyloceanibacter sp.]
MGGGPGPPAQPPSAACWLRLIRSENFGPATFRALVNEFGGAEAAIAALPMLSRRGGRAHDIGPCTEAEAELGRADSLGITLVALGEPGYPPALAHVDAPHCCSTSRVAPSSPPFPSSPSSAPATRAQSRRYRRADPHHGIATRKVQIVLLELDPAGRLQRHGQQLVSLKSPQG